MSEKTETENSPTPPTSTETPPTSLVTGETSSTEIPPETQTETTEPKTPEQIAAEEARLAPVTIEDLVLPEGFTTTDELKAEFVETINSLSDLGPKERAEALLSLQAKAMTAAQEAGSAAWNDMQDQWRTEVKADYGDKLQPTLDSINRLVTEHGSPQLVEALAVTGAGNNIHVVKFFDKIAGFLTEGKFTQGTPTAVEKTAAQRLYPSMK